MNGQTNRRTDERTDGMGRQWDDGAISTIVCNYMLNL